jgi:MFS family permease
MVQEVGVPTFAEAATGASRLVDGGAIALASVAGLYGLSQYLDVRSPHLTAGGLTLGLAFFVACAAILGAHALRSDPDTVPAGRVMLRAVGLLILGVIPALYGVSYLWYLQLGSTAGGLVGSLSGVYLFARLRPRFSRRTTSALAALFLGASIFFLLREVCFDTLTMGSQTLEPRIRQGDKVGINKLAFGLRVPFWSRYLISWASPARGELVAFLLEDGRLFIKEVIRVDGHLLEVKDLGIIQRHRLRGRVVASG